MSAVQNNEIMPFNKNQLSDLVVQGNIEGAKSYIQQYFYKIDDPQCVYYYNGVEKSFSSYDIEETKFKLSKKIPTISIFRFINCSIKCSNSY